jgi:DNA-binding MarR family transcriptional regulator
MIGRRISVIYKYGRHFIEKDLFKYGLGSGEYSFLVAIKKNKDFYQEDLSNYLLLDKTTVSRAISRLEKKELITKIEDKFDRRKNRIMLTDKGFHLINELKDYMSSWEEVLLNNFKEEEIEQLKYLLEKLEKNASNRGNYEQE